MIKTITLQALAPLLEGEVEGDESIVITGISPVSNVTAGHLVFVLEDKFLKVAEASAAAALVVKSGTKTTKPAILVEKPRLALSKALSLFNTRPTPPPGIAAHASIHPSVSLGKGVSIQDFVTIGAGTVIEEDVTLYPHVTIGPHCHIGTGSILYANVSIYDGIHIGKNVIIHGGSVIGADGFGFATDRAEHHHKVPQIGGVVIEDEVEIGALTTIDRATLGNTRIGRGTKIDNNVHIAHNCVIGENCLIVANVGISGSVTIGNHVTLAGNVGVAGHLTIGDHVIALARSGITKNIHAGSIISGFPAQDHQKELALQARLRQRLTPPSTKGP